VEIKLKLPFLMTLCICNHNIAILLSIFNLISHKDISQIREYRVELSKPGYPARTGFRLHKLGMKNII